MPVADFLEKIGQGLEKGAKVAGSVALPIAERTAQVVSGQAPQLDQEKRQQQYKLEDMQIASQAKQLEDQMALGQKYGTLTPEQSQQYVDQISQLYSHPRHAPTLMEKLRKAVHPNGAVSTPGQVLKDATPAGGTDAQDAAEKLKMQSEEAKQKQEQDQENTKASWDFFSKFIPDEDKPKAQSEWAMKNLGVAQTLKNIPGQAGQPTKGADGRYYLPKEQADGTIVQEPMPAGWAPPAPKPGTSASSVYMNTLAKKIMADNKTGPPLTPEESAQLTSSKSALTLAGIARADEMAKAMAANNLISVTDPETGVDTLVTRAQAAKSATSGNPMMAGVIGAPTAMDKKNQLLATSAISQVDRMEKILSQDPNLTGPGSGQLTQLQTWLGTQDPDAQAFIVSSLLGSEHGVAVFGGRNIKTMAELQDALGNMKTNPKALKAALEVVKETMQPFATAGGRLPQPGGVARALAPVGKPGGVKQPQVIVVSPEDMK